MAVRPVYVVSEEKTHFQKENVEFVYYSGFADIQRKKCIRSLHEQYQLAHPEKKILEVSSSSEEKLGVNLSAFNLSYVTSSGRKISVESAYHSGKIFEKGGPYRELMYLSSREAKRDERLRNSGNVIGFSLNGTDFPTEPKTYFYNWLYCKTLYLNRELANQVISYDAFSDIFFSPSKSINCQAEACAIYVSLYRKGLLEEAMKDKEHFLDIVYEK